MTSRRPHRVAAVSLNLASSTDVSSGIHLDMYPSGCSIYSHVTDFFHHPNGMRRSFMPWVTTPRRHLD